MLTRRTFTHGCLFTWLGHLKVIRSVLIVRLCDLFEASPNRREWTDNIGRSKNRHQNVGNQVVGVTKVYWKYTFRTVKYMNEFKEITEGRRMSYFKFNESTRVPRRTRQITNAKVKIDNSITGVVVSTECTSRSLSKTKSVEVRNSHAKDDDLNRKEEKTDGFQFSHKIRITLSSLMIVHKELIW